MARLTDGMAARTDFVQPDEKRRLLDLANSVGTFISLGRGDPDLPTPQQIAEAGIDAIRAGATGYTQWPGLPELRAAIARMYSTKRGVPVDTGEVLVTVGAQEAVYLAMVGYLDPGDEIIMIEPRYTTYDIAIHMAGGVVVSLPSSGDNGFAPDPAVVENAVTDRTKAILLVSPNNPTGTIAHDETLEAIAEIARKHDLIVISDELYSGLVFDGVQAKSIASLPGMKERTLIINGFSKSYSMTGWRVGYLITTTAAVSIFTQIKSATTICAPQPSQYAALKAIRDGENETRELCRVYDERRRLVMNSLDAMGVPYVRPEGAFYLFARIDSVFSGTAYEFAEKLLVQKKVLVFPGTIFGASGEGFVRISLLADVKSLTVAMERIAEFVADCGGAL